MTNFRSRSIAFIFYPNDPEHIHLYTMPFALNILNKVAAVGWPIDVFLWENAGSYYENLFPPNVRIEHLQTYTKRTKLKIAELALRFGRYTAYSCVFGVGQLGSYVAGIVSMLSRCPFVLLNDEFPSFWGHSVWSSLEKWSAHRADLIILPSEGREKRLRDELGLDSKKPFVTIRNTPQIIHPLEEVDWHSRLGIPRDKQIFIHAGTLKDWAQIPEILMSVKCWEADSVLVLHSKVKDEALRYKRQLSHLDDPARVYWSFEPLSESMLHSLISYSSGSFALYRNCDVNIELIGTASGKLMRSIVCGTPVITSSLKSLDFVTREGVGIQVNHPWEIPVAVDDLKKNNRAYRKQCGRFSVAEKSLRDQGWARIVECVRRTSKSVDLSLPGG
jgi:hypothetical protein